MSRNCNMPYITSFVTLLCKWRKLAGNADDLRYESYYEMDQDASPDRLVLLIKITCQSAEDRCSEHHRKLIAHVNDEEEQSGHPDRKMLVVFLAGCSDVILDNTLYEDLLQYSADGIEPAHICAQIKSEPGLLRITRNKDILYHAYDDKTDDEAYADDAADYEVILDSLFAGI